MAQNWKKDRKPFWMCWAFDGHQIYNLHFKAIHNGYASIGIQCFVPSILWFAIHGFESLAFSIFYRFAITIAISGHETSQSNQHFCWGFFLFVLARKQTVKNDLSIEFHTVNRCTGTEFLWQKHKRWVKLISLFI